MSKLADLQQQVFCSLIDEAPIDATLFKKNKLLSLEKSLSIYRNSFMTALLNALREVYEVCAKITGDKFFNAMAMIYIQKTPSHSENMGHYGKEFSTFIADFPPAKELSYLSDVARLEWAWYEALHAENVEPFNPENLAELSEEAHDKVVFTLPPSMTVIASDYPIDHIWHFHQVGYTGGSTVNLDQGGVELLVWRQAMDMRMDILKENEHALLEVLAQGAAIGELDNFLDEAQLMHISDLLADFVKKGWVAGFEVA